MIGQRLVAIGAMVGTLAFAYLLDHHLLDPARRASEDESGTVAYLWLAAASYAGLWPWGKAMQRDWASCGMRSAAGSMWTSIGMET